MLFFQTLHNINLLFVTTRFRELFTTVVDMLTTLVHSTLVSDGQSERDEKFYSNLMKKLKKEIGEKNNTSIKVIRQLLPLYKQPTEVSLKEIPFFLSHTRVYL